MALSIMTLGIRTFSITTFSITILNIKVLIATQYNQVPNGDCRYAESGIFYVYAEYR